MLSFAVWYLLKNIFLLIGELSPFIFIDVTFDLSYIILFYVLFTIFIFHILLIPRLMFSRILTFMKSRCIFQLIACSSLFGNFFFLSRT